jgi:hypothetical protein
MTSSQIEGNATGGDLTSFLKKCLKASQVSRVKQQLEAQGVDYEDILQCLEQDLRAILAEAKVNTLNTGRIIGYLNQNKESGVYQSTHKPGKGVVVLTTEQNNLLSAVQGTCETVSKNVKHVQNGIHKLHANSKQTQVEINQKYDLLIEQIQNRRQNMLQKVEQIENQKLKQLQSQLETGLKLEQNTTKSQQELKHLMNEDDNKNKKQSYKYTQVEGMTNRHTLFTHTEV